MLQNSCFLIRSCSICIVQVMWSFLSIILNSSQGRWEDLHLQSLPSWNGLQLACLQTWHLGAAPWNGELVCHQGKAIGEHHWCHWHPWHPACSTPLVAAAAVFLAVPKPGSARRGRRGDNHEVGHDCNTGGNRYSMVFEPIEYTMI